MSDVQELILCNTTGKLLAKRSEQGIWLYCKECHEQHLFTWYQLGYTKEDTESHEPRPQPGRGSIR